jgi:hypothetical protein
MDKKKEGEVRMLKCDWIFGRCQGEDVEKVEIKDITGIYVFYLCQKHRSQLNINKIKKFKKVEL